MIEKIHLGHFGKFNEKGFPLARCTLFFGKNEAGKTTLFDAFFNSLCSPGKGTVWGKRIISRYGDKISVTLSGPSVPGEVLGVGDFLNVNSIRSGDVTLGDNADWESDVISRLAGIDLDALIGKLEKLCAETGNNKHLRAIKETKLQLSQLGKDLLGKVAERDQILGREKEISNFGEQLKELTAKIGKSNSELEALKRCLVAKKHNAKKEELIRHRNSLNSIMALDKEIELFSGVRNAGDAKPKEFEGQREKLLRELGDTRASLEEIKKVLSTAKEKHDRLNSGLSQLKQMSDEAAEASRSINQAIAEPSFSQQVTWVRSRIGMAFGALMIGVILAFLTQSPLDLICIGVGVVVACGLGFWARRSEMVKDVQALETKLGGLANRWNVMYSSHPIEGRNSSAALGVLSEIVNAHRLLETQILESVQTVASSKEELHKKSMTLEEADRALKIVLDDEASFYRSIGVQGKDAYLIKKAELAQKTSQLLEKKGLLPAELGALSVIEASVLVETQIRSLETLDEGEVPEDFMTDTSLQELEKRIVAKLTAHEKLRAEFAERDKKQEGSSSLLKGEMKGIPEAILRLEADLAGAQAELLELESDKKGARMAADLFSELKRDSSHRLDGVNMRVQELIRLALGQERFVATSGFNDSLVFMGDAGGVSREAQNLSQGTRDLLLLAVKIALSEQLKSPLPVLLLDEPFLSMDKEREVQALKMIAEFQKKSEWQVIIFTKEESIKAAVREIFGGAAVHELDVGSP
ncbi:hypothetical protein WDW86_22310 [Bdellovibrionota bacterium FG-2]